MTQEEAPPPIRVLLVEDDEDDYILTRDALRSIGPRRMVLQWVDNSERALVELESGRHDVCLLDYRLGSSTGLELLEQARRGGWRGPVILLTAQEDDSLDRRAMEAGAADFLEKSQLTPTLLDRSIRYALQHARALAELDRSQRSFRELIERLPDGVAVQQGDRIVYANPALVTMMGCASPAELVEQQTATIGGTFIHPDDRIWHQPDFQEALRTGRPLPTREVRLLRKGGGLVTAEVSQSMVVFDGQPSRVHILRDITERKQMQGRLLLADRMASLGTLAAGMAHEINNPLAFTLSNMEHLETELLPRLGGEQEEARKLLADARTGAGRVRDIVRQLKMFSRAEEDVRAEPVDVHRALEAAIGMAGNEIRHRARLVRDYAPEPLVVEANEGRLGQVFLNLLVNAAQAISEGDVERQEILVRTRPHAEGVAIEVRDTGAGIPADHLERVFEPFFTTKPVGVGTGLGLSICHGIVTGFGGRMEVESQIGRGSTFRLLLRAARAPSPVEQRQRPAVAPAAPRRGRILVVDDEPMMGVAVRRTLQREHDVVTLTSAREAHARLVGGEHFDLILCDVMMPEMSGMELHQELARHDPSLTERMVFLTGGAFTPNARAFLEQAGIRRVDKPFSSQELRQLVQTLLASRASGTA